MIAACTNAAKTAAQPLEAPYKNNVMTPAKFIALWQSNKLTERAGAQAHFDDLCELLGVDKPRDPDNYCFERGAKKSSGGDGWADVWKRGHFAWENKKPGRNLDKALKQLTDYALQLDSPPLLVVCDRERIIIHTAFTGYPDEPREIRIEELVDDSKRQVLKWVFSDPLKLRPEKSTAAVTEEAARRFAEVAEAMRLRGLDSNQVAHFLVQCLFCMFAEDEGMLPEKIFSRLLTNAKSDVAKAANRIEKLFKAMQEPKGVYGDDDINWFNGGLFKQIKIPPLTASDLEILRAASTDMDWRAIDPTIFGTLFERGLGSKRAALGAHYTDTGTISKLVQPLVHEPLVAEWMATREKILALLEKSKAFDDAKVAATGEKVTSQAKKELERKLTAAKTASTRALNEANKLYTTFLLRLNHFRVLDPACGSGNFLYLALKALRDVEKRVQIDAQEMGLQAQTEMQTGPHSILGIEINEFAAELARVTVWIGDIQWCRQNGWQHSVNPILKPLDGIENRDALINLDGSETIWPRANVIVGNPPFIGDKKMRGELGETYVTTLRKLYEGRVPGGADLVCYWFEKSRAQIEVGRLDAAGLVSTNSIRGGANRKILERIIGTTQIFLAWSDEPWVNDGAAVRVSMTGFGCREGVTFNGEKVDFIHSDLTADIGLDLTKAKKLPENSGVSFMGVTKSGPFDIPREVAMRLLSTPNPHGRSTAEVVLPSIDGSDLAKRPSGDWIINFGTRSEGEAALFEPAFEYAESHIKAERQKSKTLKNREQWWLFERARPEMFEAFGKQNRYLATCLVAKHRFFVWQDRCVVPENVVIVFARSDDITFGILHSRFHEVWSLRMCTFLGVGNDPRYTPTTCFETFPFPEGMTPKNTKLGVPDSSAAKTIEGVAKNLDELRKNWLNPDEWTDWVTTPQEQAAGFPKRPVAKPGHENDLRTRTLTNLYNQRPTWLAIAHEALDKAVAAAYGWKDYLPQWTDENILHRLLALNLGHGTQHVLAKG